MDWKYIIYFWLSVTIFLAVLRLVWRFLKIFFTKNQTILKYRIGYNRILITVGGVGPWGLSKTRTGLQLGDSYKLVLWVCGYPESQRYAGRFLRLSYVDKSRVLYTFLNKKMVGVTIALVQEELAQK